MNILICEDDKTIQELIGIIVEEMGHKLYKCAEGEILLQTLSIEKIDLVILDYWLNKMKADNIVKKLKEDYSNIPIILMSAISQLPEISDKLGVNDYLKKPFDIEVLKTKINTLLPYDSNISNN